MKSQITNVGLLTPFLGIKPPLFFNFTLTINSKLIRISWVNTHSNNWFSIETTTWLAHGIHPNSSN